MNLGALALGALLAAAFVSGCSDDDNTAQDAGVDASQDASVVPTIPLEVACDDTFDAVYGDPGTLPGEHGAILKCNAGAPMSKEDVQAAIDETGYSGDAMTSGAQVYHVTYETVRGDEDPGYSSALVLVPDTPRADPLPVIVASHGSFGQAELCAPSRFDEASSYTQDDYIRLIYPLVGAGYAVIAPDLAGYANWGADGNPPSAYGNSKEVAYSTLDGVTALRNLIGSHLSTSVIIEGHSQGGHTALSALAYADSYGLDGTLAGVVVYAPLWISARLVGAMLYLPSSYTIAGDTKAFVATSVWYHYTNSALLEPGSELDVFRSSAQSAVEDFIDTTCWSPSYPGLEAVGTDIGDLFTDEYAAAIGVPAALNGDCRGDALCEKWMDRFAASRPHLTGDATSIPILLNYGMQDPTLSPGFMACVVERLVTQDGANVSACVKQNANHNTVMSQTASYTNKWIAWKTLGETEPSNDVCDDTLSSWVTEDGTMLQTCAIPPPND